jgi:hypothetical protein
MRPTKDAIIPRIRRFGSAISHSAPYVVQDRLARPCWQTAKDADKTLVCRPILAQEGVYDAFTKRLGETAGAMKVADGFEPGTCDRTARQHKGQVIFFGVTVPTKLQDRD